MSIPPSAPGGNCGKFRPAMPILAVVLLLTSAVLHAFWNLILKQSSEKYVAMGWQVIISGIISVIALSIALVISIYTLIDGFAVKHGPVMPYGLSMFMLVPVLTTPVIVRHYGRDHFVKAWKDQPARLILVGFLGVIAYLFALFAYSIAPVNYSEAIREVSVVIGAFAGWQLLGEKLGKTRVLGAAVIFAGIVLIAVFG